MDGELVSGSSSDTEGEEGIDPASPYAYSRLFEREFPYYLAMGMSYDQYWNGDAELPRAYRKAHRIKEDQRNHDMWLQGMYVFEALCDASPLFHDWGKRGTKAHDYPKEPYDLHPDETAKKNQRKREKKIAAKGMNFMKMFMRQHNSRHGGDELA